MRLAIAKHLDQPRKAYGVSVQIKDMQWDAAKKERVHVGYKDASVWHCSLSLRAEEGALTDQQWGDIANDFVDAMGFTEASGKAQCRWAAVNHGTSENGNHHIHLAVSLVREDGTKASTHGDYKTGAADLPGAGGQVRAGTALHRARHPRLRPGREGHRRPGRAGNAPRIPGPESPRQRQRLGDRR